MIQLYKAYRVTFLILSIPLLINTVYASESKKLSAKLYSFITIDKFELLNNRTLMIKGIIQWRIEDVDKFNETTSYKDIAESRIHDYYFVFLYEEIVNRYASSEFPSEIPDYIIDRIITNSNSSLKQENFGILVSSIDTEIL